MLMDLHNYLQFGVAVLGLLGGLFAYILGLRIQHDILANNEKIEKEIASVKESTGVVLTNFRNEMTREFGGHITKQAERIEYLERTLGELGANLSDKVLSIVNGKYVRTDLNQQSLSNIQDRFASMKELIEVNMDKIEQGLDRQILDLKDRIFHDQKTT